MMLHLVGIYDKVCGNFSVFHFVDDVSTATRGFILQMAHPCDLSYFHDDFELYDLGLIDQDTAVYSAFSSRKLLLTGSQAYRAMKEYEFDKADTVEPDEDEKNA